MAKAPPWIQRIGTSETTSVGTTHSAGVPAGFSVEYVTPNGGGMISPAWENASLTRIKSKGGATARAARNDFQRATASGLANIYLLGA